MQQRASGSFQVQMEAQAQSDATQGATLGRLALHKQFDGDLQAKGEGEMLTAMTEIKGSAGYVAIERVTGSLHGKQGSFVLQHSGSMDRGAQSLSIIVVPDSATGELQGLSGKLSITITGGKHFYDFDYSLPQ